MRILLLSILAFLLFNSSGQSQSLDYLALKSNGDEISLPGPNEYSLHKHSIIIQEASSLDFDLINLFENKQTSSNFSISKSKNGHGKRNSKYLMRSTLGMNGLSKMLETDNGSYVFRQSIGQTSVIGTHSNGKHIIRQGFQQPLNSRKKTQAKRENSLNAKIYPNPFYESINVSVEEDINNNLYVIIYAISGKKILSKKYPPLQFFSIPLNHLPKGDYIIKLRMGSKHFVTKLIKQ